MKKKIGIFILLSNLILIFFQSGIFFNIAINSKKLIKKIYQTQFLITLYEMIR